MIAAATSLEQYLSTTYEPDMEYVGGELVERSVGSQRHGFLQAAIAEFLRQHRTTHSIAVFTETRLQMANRRDHRIPDVMVVNRPFAHGLVIIDVPLALFEIMSPDDKFNSVLDKCGEYSQLGVPHIVVIDPQRHRTFEFSGGNLVRIETPVLRCPAGELLVPISQMYLEYED